MALGLQTYRRLLQARKSYRSFSQTALVPRELWREFLTEALKPVFRVGVKLPAAGGFSDYAVFLFADRLSGKRRGLYRVYVSRTGVLRFDRLDVPLEALEAWLRWATAGGKDPQAALVLIGRGSAIRAKYGSRGTELLFQNVGIVQAHLYLAATSCGLNGCAIGWVDHRLVHEWVELDRGDAVVAFEFGL